MVLHSTFGELVDYAYNQIGFCDSDRIQRNLDGDPVLSQEYSELLEIIKILDSSVPTVSNRCIENILRMC